MRWIGSFLLQWLENIDFLRYNYFSGGMDIVTFPLTHNPYGPWALLPKSSKARKAMLRVKRIMGPQHCYAFLRTHPELAGVSLGGIPGPRNIDDALIALGTQAAADLWQQEHDAREQWRKNQQTPSGV